MGKVCTTVAYSMAHLKPFQSVIIHGDNFECVIYISD